MQSEPSGKDRVGHSFLQLQTCQPEGIPRENQATRAQPIDWRARQLGQDASTYLLPLLLLYRFYTLANEVCDSGTSFVELQAHHPTPPFPLTEKIAPQNVPAFFQAPFKSKPPAALVPEDHKKWEREIHALNEDLREEFRVYQSRSDARRVAD